MGKRIGTVDAPEKPITIPANVQWLLGQGAGAWFSIESTKDENRFAIKRFTAEGNLDCNRVFEVEENGSIFDITKEYEFTHISHCAKCRIIQNEIVFVFNYKEE
jgi:hypothetical protein